jgi:predicted nucleotide-binding protein
MAKGSLRDRLAEKLAVSTRTIDRRVHEIMVSHHVSSHVATLILGTQHGFPANSYGNPQEVEQVRGALHGFGPTAARISPDPMPLRETITVRDRLRMRAKLQKPPTRRIKATKNNSIFVVHGRDEKLRESIFALLRAMGLNPMEWSEAIAKAKGANPNIGQTIDNAMKRVQGVLVMFSPDEQSKLNGRFCRPKEKTTLGKLGPQSRPNVIFEAGLALGAHPKKTLLVQVGEMRDLSDIAGKHILHFNGSFASRNELAQRLKKIGFKPNTSNQDWTTAGEFKR